MTYDRTPTVHFDFSMVSQRFDGAPGALQPNLVDQLLHEVRSAIKDSDPAPTNLVSAIYAASADRT